MVTIAPTHEQRFHVCFSTEPNQRSVLQIRGKQDFQ